MTTQKTKQGHEENYKKDHAKTNQDHRESKQDQAKK